jgi:hypothetical protein
MGHNVAIGFRGSGSAADDWWILVESGKFLCDTLHCVLSGRQGCSLSNISCHGRISVANACQPRFLALGGTCVYDSKY